jgi:hypothetical protein
MPSGAGADAADGTSVDAASCAELRCRIFFMGSSSIHANWVV